MQILVANPAPAAELSAPSTQPALSSWRSLRRHFEGAGTRCDVLLAFGLLLFAAYGGYANPIVRFDRERIEVRVVPGQIQVSGLYHYRNPLRLPAPVTLEVPFPVDASHSSPTTFSISTSNEAGATRDLIRPALRHGKVNFRLLFRPGEEKWVRVDYVQSTRVSQGTYILITTRAWGRPLDHGDYVLRLAPRLALVASSYPLEASAVPNTYQFSRNDFYPDRDWKFAWREWQPSAPDAGGRP